MAAKGWSCQNQLQPGGGESPAPSQEELLQCSITADATPGMPFRRSVFDHPFLYGVKEAHLKVVKPF